MNDNILLKEAIDAICAIEYSLREGHMELEEITLMELCVQPYRFGIKFLDTFIWDSENEPRPFNEERNEYEPLIDYLKARVETMLIMLSRLTMVPGQRMARKHAAEDLRDTISIFLDEIDAGGTPSYDSLRAVLKQYEDI